MLERIREGAKGTLAMTVLGLIVLSFVFAGVGNYFTSSTSIAAAEVNGEEILQTTVERAYQNEKARMESQFGEAFSVLSANADYLARLRSGVLDRLISDVLVNQQAEKMGLRVSDQAIRETIVSMQEFQIDGTFNNERYQTLLRQSGFSPADFSDYLRVEMTRQQLSQALLGSDFALPKEVDLAFRLQQQTRDGQYLNVPASLFKQEVDISEAQIENYYQANISQFDTQKKVSLSYVKLSSSELVNEVEVTEQDVQDYYNTYQDRYRQPAERKASHILVEFGDDEQAAQQKADDLLQQLNQGADFTELATTQSDDVFSAEQGGNLDWFKYEDMDAAFSEAAFALVNIDDTTEVVRSEFGFHIIKLDGVKEEQVTMLEDVKEDIEQSLQQDKAAELFYERQQRAAELAFEIPESLDEVALELNVELRTSELFERALAPAELDDPRILDLAFSADFVEERLNSDVIELSDGEMIVLRVEQFEPASTRSLQEVSEQISQTLTLQGAQQMAKEWAENVLKQMEEGETVQVILEEKSLDWQMLSAQQRQGGEAGQGVIEALFKLAPAEGENRVVEVINEDTVALVQLNNVNQPEPIEQALQAQLAASLSTGRAQEMLTAMVEALKQNSDIKTF
jgi:peptidyl-prolyl cis-trans isomerase D